MSHLKKSDFSTNGRTIDSNMKKSRHTLYLFLPKNCIKWFIVLNANFKTLKFLKATGENLIILEFGSEILYIKLRVRSMKEKMTLDLD